MIVQNDTDKALVVVGTSTTLIPAGTAREVSTSREGRVRVMTALGLTEGVVIVPENFAMALVLDSDLSRAARDEIEVCLRGATDKQRIRVPVSSALRSALVDYLVAARSKWAAKRATTDNRAAEKAMWLGLLKVGERVLRELRAMGLEDG